MTTTIEATYEHGILRPKHKLPFREHARVILVVRPTDPVSRTRGIFHLPRRLAKVLIYDDTLLDA